MTNHRYMDNTRISDFRRCPRYYYFRHIRNWVPQYKSIALINGSAWHEAMNVVWALAKDQSIPNMAILRQAYTAYVECWIKEGLKDPADMTLPEIEAISPRGPFIAKEILWNYIVKRRDLISQVEILDIERPIAVPILKQNTEVQVYYVGRLDKAVVHPQYGKLIVEHKTTAWYATAGLFRQEFIDSFSPNSQIDGYIFAANIIYGGIKAVWVDAALFHKKIFDGFKFIVIDRQFEMIDNWLAETLYWVERIRDDQQKLETTGQLQRTFPKDTGSCSSYGGCPYRDICRFYDNPHTVKEPPAGFRVEVWNPFDVLKLEKLELKPEEVQDDATR